MKKTYHGTRYPEGISRQNLIKNRRISTEPRLNTIIRLIDALEIEPNALFFR